MARFTDKVIIVTGGGSGIGRAACVRFGAEGGAVIIADRDPQGGAETVKTITDAGGKAEFVQVDVSNADQIKACVDHAVSTYGKVDVMVNNAAMMTFTPIVDLAIEDWDRVQGVNMRSVFLFCKYCLPHMNGGAIVNVSSVHAHQTTPNVIPYASAARGLWKPLPAGFRREIDATQARVNAVAPGAVRHAYALE